jgi:UDP-N-acetyl-D-mannosaminuronic acid dehydrogenase
LGLSYKPDVDDLRESPVLELFHKLIHRRAIVKAYEPFRLDSSFGGISISHDLADALIDADVIMPAVGHSQFIALKPDELASMTKCRCIFDPIQGWDEVIWEKAGFVYMGLGISQNG